MAEILHFTFLTLPYLPTLTHRIGKAISTFPLTVAFLYQGTDGLSRSIECSFLIGCFLSLI